MYLFKSIPKVGQSGIAKPLQKASYHKESANALNHSSDLLQKENERGQVFIEFLLFLIIIVTLSQFLMGGVNSALAERWETLIKVISEPTDSEVRIR